MCIHIFTKRTYVLRLVILFKELQASGRTSERGYRETVLMEILLWRRAMHWFPRSRGTQVQNDRP